MESIKHANQFKNNNLDFHVHDMRVPFPIQGDAIFNMFTSFGYFYDDREDIQVLENIHSALNDNGRAVIDYLNIEKVTAKLVAEETIERENIQFKIKRKLKTGSYINTFLLKLR